MKKSFLNLLFLSLFITNFSYSQKTIENSEANENYKVTHVINLEYKYIPSISEQIKNGTFVAADPEDYKKDGPPKRMLANKVVPGKGLPKGKDPLVNFNNKKNKIQSREPALIFQTTSQTATPGDPTGEIGRDYYFASWNSAFRFFNLDGSPASPATSLNSLFGPNQSGDPIVLYDSQADRYVISSMGSSSLNFAVSVSNDPINDGWHVYNAASNQFPTSGQFPDYPKYSIWSDGYYCTTNTSGDNLFVLERDKILVGDPTASLQAFDTPSMSTSGFSSAQIFDIVDNNHPSAGNATLVYLQDDSWAGVNYDHLKIWSVNIDWDNPSNSSISNPVELPTTPFNSVFDGGSFNNLEQPSGPDIDAMQAMIMNQAQYRKFDNYNSAIFNFVVNTVAVGKLAGVRWYELRQSGDGQAWTIHQEGTYLAPDGRHAFGASMSMDIQGNIGMGYSSVSSSESVSLRYTGRYANDPLGEMTLEEGLVVQSTGNSNNTRYADYAHLSVDPTNEKQFWYVSEYFGPGRSHMVGVFQIAPDAAYDTGIVSIDSPTSGLLTDSEIITISIFNYGENSISNFDVSYQLDDGTIITETFTGTIASGETAQYTFTSTVDMSILGNIYNITSFVTVSEDGDFENDFFTAEVTHLNANDIGVSNIVSPVSGELLSSSEQVTITINNFGGATQYDFDVTFEINGVSYTETVPGPLAPNSFIEYTFNQTVDLSSFGTYAMVAYTSLDTDFDPTNDLLQSSITNINCSPVADCAGYDDGFQLFQLADIDNPSGCEGGYSNFTNLSTDLVVGDTYDVTVTTGYGDQHVRIWIDYNDDFIFSLDEMVVSDYEIANGQGQGSYTETFQMTIPEGAVLGTHIMRIKSNWQSQVPDDACEDTTYGETEDYTVNLVTSLGFGNFELNNSELIIYSTDNNMFNIKLNTNESDLMTFSVYDTTGKIIVFNNIEKMNNNAYLYDLDMSYASPGVYFVKIGNSSLGHKIGRIIVK